MNKHKPIDVFYVYTAIMIPIILIVFYLARLQSRMIGVSYKHFESVSVPYQYKYMETYDIPRTFGFREIDTVISVSHKYGVPEPIAFRLIYVESRFDSTAVNKTSGCWGYMGLSPKYFTAKNRFENIEQGLAFLSARRFALGSWEDALSYYNSGECMCSRSEYLNFVLYGHK